MATPPNGVSTISTSYDIWENSGQNSPPIPRHPLRRSGEFSSLTSLLETVQEIATPPVYPPRTEEKERLP